MKGLHDRTTNLQSQNVATELAECVAMIFEKYPLLCGFTVQPRNTLTTERAKVLLQRDLCLADVAVNTPPGYRATQDFCNQIADMLLDLMKEQPEAIDLLRSCTFARTLH